MDMRAKHWFYTLPLRVRSLFRHRRVEEELAEELEYHIAKKSEEFAAMGLGQKEAREAAMREFGGLEQVKESCRDTRKLALVEDTLQDIRYGFRSALALALGGIGLGIVAALAATRLVRSLLYNVDPADLFTFFGVSLLLLLMALLASYIPARRATRVDPTLALRYE
jgi:beta-phosphoglucomutase-like phosphatase (HAD superfamily)